MAKLSSYLQIAIQMRTSLFVEEPVAAAYYRSAGRTNFEFRPELFRQQRQQHAYGLYYHVNLGWVLNLPKATATTSAAIRNSPDLTNCQSQRVQRYRGSLGDQ